MLCQCCRTDLIDAFLRAAALTKALIIEQRKHDATAATDRACHAEPRKIRQDLELVHKRIPGLEEAGGHALDGKRGPSSGHSSASGKGICTICSDRSSWPQSSYRQADQVGDT